MANTAPPAPANATVGIAVEFLQAALSLTTQIPPVFSLVQKALEVLGKGAVTPEEQAYYRAQLDDVKAQIDAA